MNTNTLYHINFLLIFQQNLLKLRKSVTKYVTAYFQQKKEEQMKRSSNFVLLAIQKC